MTKNKTKKWLKLFEYLSKINFGRVEIEIRDNLPYRIIKKEESILINNLDSIDKVLRREYTEK